MSTQIPKTLAIILSDFGRDAALRFCALLSDLERRQICEYLPEGATFYDEYRRLSLVLIGDLGFAKAPVLDTYDGLLDDRVLVGFPSGLTPHDVAARLGVLALQAMVGAVHRGVEQIFVLVPCNTLAPVQWQLQQSFSSEAGLRAMLAETSMSAEPYGDVLSRLAQLSTIFPTVPEAVVERAVKEGIATILPLGTVEIDEVYRQAVARQGQEMTLLRPDQAGRDAVLHAIQAGISKSGAARKLARANLTKLVLGFQEIHGDLLCVEACTDLDYGVGLDSNTVYAQAVVEAVYGPSCST
ncbi:MAG: hypothetical protein HN348_01980 [Proteobacteria bacterium]|jgi:hypothetical protein|nr:hypothetical protein [Pseudomonadota bacterium]